MTNSEEKKLRTYIAILETAIKKAAARHDECVYYILRTPCDGCREGCPRFEPSQRVAA